MNITGAHAPRSLIPCAEAQRPPTPDQCRMCVFDCGLVPPAFKKTIISDNRGTASAIFQDLTKFFCFSFYCWSHIKKIKKKPQAAFLEKANTGILGSSMRRAGQPVAVEQTGKGPRLRSSAQTPRSGERAGTLTQLGGWRGGRVEGWGRTNPSSRAAGGTSSVAALNQRSVRVNRIYETFENEQRG